MLIWCLYTSPSQLHYPSSVIDTLGADHLTFPGGGRSGGGGGGGISYTRPQLEKSQTRSVNRKKNSVTQG